MTQTLLVRNCRLYTAAAGAPSVNIHIRAGRIAEIGVVASPPEGIHVLDAGGRTVIPGLIDIHIHGAGGADALDGSAAALATISQSLARLGTTSFLATTVMRPDTGSRHLAVAAEQVGGELGGANLLGLYLEGPFVNLGKRGGIPPSAIYASSPAALDEVLALTGDTLRVMTVAPELPGNLEIIERLAARGIIVAFGHSAATYEETRAGFAAGIRHVTHLYNAMSGLHHRAPGPLVAIHEAEEIPVEIISDNVHVDRHVIRWTRHLFGERCICVTDAMRAVGLPDGRYLYSGREYESAGGAARYLDGTLIGTSVSLWQLTRRFREYTGCSLAAAVDAASRIPARLLGIDARKGSLEPGKDADIVILETDESVWATLVGGRAVEFAEPPDPRSLAADT